MEVIKSKDNKKFKYLMKLKNKKYREKEKKFLIEGNNIIDEALKLKLVDLYITSNKDISYKNTLYLDEKLINKLSSLKNANYDLALLKFKEDKEITSDQILILDDISDPNNLGTIFRTALAFNFKDIIISENTVDIYNPKVLRASEGAIFNLNILRRNLIDEVKNLKKKNYKIISTDLNAKDLKDLKITNKFAIVIGNEGRGIREEILNLSDSRVKIPIDGIDSLNVHIATAIILYEIRK